MINETAKSTVLIDGKQAEEALKELQSEGKKLRQEMERLKKANDLSGFEKVKKEVEANTRAQKALKVELFSVDKVMKNLSGSSMHQLKAAQRAITVELNRMTRGTAEYIAKSKELKQVNAEIAKVRKEMGLTAGAQQSWLGKANGFFSKWGGWVLGATAAVTGLSLGLRKLATDANEFESRLANLSALTGLSGSSLDYLADEAKKLSVGITQDGVRITKSANDIVDAFTLMGSAKPELLKNKEALAEVTTEALKLAEAAKMDTKTAVESLANVMNQFSAGSDEASRYINVLAAGSKEGAAAVDSIASSIIKFGPAAASANISVEESVGLIETLAEKGVKGEIAGTQLRTALLKLQTGADEFNPKVVGLNTALDNLSKANLSAGDMVKMFGQEAYLAGAILINNKDQVERYTKAVTGTNVATEQAVKNTQTMAAQLEQARNRMKLAALELGQKLGGALVFSTNMVRKFINVIIDANNVFTRWRKGVPQGFSDAAIKIQDEQKSVNRLVMQLTDANTKELDRKKIIEELNSISPTLVRNLDAENIKLEQLKLNLKAYNEEASNRIILANLEADEQKALSKLADARQKVAETQVLLQAVMLDAKQDMALSQGTFNEKLQATAKYLTEQVAIQEKEGRLGDVRVTKAGNVVDYRTKEQKLLQNILDYNTALLRNQEKLSLVESKSFDYQKRISALKEILGLNKQIAVGGTGNGTDPVDPGSDETGNDDYLKNFEAQFAQRRLLLIQQRNEEQITEQQYNDALLAMEWQYLYDKKRLYEQHGEDVGAIDMQIAEKEKAEADKAAKAAEEAMRRKMEQSKKEADEIVKNREAETAAVNENLNKQNQAEQDNNARRLENERQLQEELRRIREQGVIDAINVGTDLAAGLIEAQIEMAGQSEEEAEQTKKRMIIMALEALEQIANIAIAQIFAKEIASKSFAGILSATILTGLVKAAVGAAKAKVNQRAAGKYDVIGAEDGHTYRGVPFKGNMQTGIYSTPTLVAERGPELVVDAGTLRNLQVNFPHVLPAIRAAMVPQRAEGNVVSHQSTNQPLSQSADPEFKALLKQTATLLDSLYRKGIDARMSYDHYKSQTEKAQAIEQATSRT